VIVIRECAGFEELQACVDLQVETWGYDATDMMPRKAFLVMQKAGGQVIGAFDTELAGKGMRDGNRTARGDGANGRDHEEQMWGDANSMVGFALSLPGVKGGEKFPDGEPRAYLHSHMLAVREGYRNRGIGAQLKLEQRREALTRGIRHMEWTFDPLEIKNAFLNIHKLGAIAHHYRENFYGVSSSRLQGGLPTDRLLAEWHLDSERIKSILAGRGADKGPIEERITVPASIYEWKASERYRDRALAVQLENRHRFQQAFSRGLAVLGFTRDAEGNGIFELGTPARLEAGIQTLQGTADL
jgi:predicted GNAT superfamily acetyltransferase